MEYLMTVTAAIELRKAQQFKKTAIDKLDKLKLRLLDRLKSADRHTLAKLMGLYKIQGRSWERDLVQYTEHLRGENITPVHKDALVCQSATGMEQHVGS